MPSWQDLGMNWLTIKLCGFIPVVCILRAKKIPVIIEMARRAGSNKQDMGLNGLTINQFCAC